MLLREIIMKNIRYLYKKIISITVNLSPDIFPIAKKEIIQNYPNT